MAKWIEPSAKEADFASAPQNRSHVRVGSELLPVRAGQVWEDKDKRMEGDQKKLVAVNYARGIALTRSVTDRGINSTVSIENLGSRFRFVREEEEEEEETNR